MSTLKSQGAGHVREVAMCANYQRRGKGIRVFLLPARENTESFAGSGQQKGDRGGDCGGGKIYGVVAENAVGVPVLRQEAVGDHADYSGSGADHSGAPSDDAGEAYCDGGDKSGSGSGEGDGTIGSGWHGLPDRDQPGSAANGLADFAGDGVGGGFG